jgi:hypothetical protein
MQLLQTFQPTDAIERVSLAFPQRSQTESSTGPFLHSSSRRLTHVQQMKSRTVVVLHSRESAGVTRVPQTLQVNSR